MTLAEYESRQFYIMAVFHNLSTSIKHVTNTGPNIELVLAILPNDQLIKSK